MKYLIYYQDEIIGATKDLEEAKNLVEYYNKKEKTDQYYLMEENK